VEAARGETAAFAALVRRHASQVQAVIERAVGDHHRAADLCQEVWVKVLRDLNAFEPRRRFRPWLFAIALNHARDDLRRNGRRRERVRLQALPADLPAPRDEALASREERDELEAALDAVPEPYRGALHLVDVVGLDYEEAARSLECSLGTLKSRVHRGRLAFREAYLARERRGRGRTN